MSTFLEHSLTILSLTMLSFLFFEHIKQQRRIEQLETEHRTSLKFDADLEARVNRFAPSDHEERIAKLERVAGLRGER